VQTKPENNWTPISILSFVLYLIFSQPKMNLKMVLKIQKIELNLVAPYLSLIPFLMAYVGLHEGMVT
jgi:hypothetical protein